MDNLKLKQRIVGAIVLVGLGVIFIPMILTGGDDSMPLFGSNIPEQPDNLSKLKSLEMPARPAVPPAPVSSRIPVNKNTSTNIAPAEVKGDKKISNPTTAPRSSRNTEKADTGDNKAVQAWVVQVGSFSKRANAMALRDKLRKKNHPAFVELLKSGNKSVYRVRVGPDVTRTLAEKRMRKLRDKMKLYGVVMHHP